MKYCSKCGKQLEDNAKFCDNCGTPASTPNNPSAQKTYSSGGGEQDGNGKKTIILLAVALAVVVVICAVVLIVFAMKNNSEETVEVTTAAETVATTQAPNNSADNARYKSLLERFNKAKLKAAKRGVKVKKQKNAAKEALDQYRGVIDSNDTTLMSKYADDAEKYVSKLESAANKQKKVKKGTASAPQQKVRSQYNVPESAKTNYRVAPDSAVGEYYFDDILDDDVDRYAATTLAINEYYARHGCQFQTAALQKYFEHQKWYTNLGKSTASVALTGREASNAKRLQKDREWYKKNMAGASGQATDFSYEDYMDIGRAIG